MTRLNQIATLGRRDIGGGAAVEFALALPMLALLFIGAFDFARAFNTAQGVTAAARAGAEYAHNSAACQSGINVLNSPQITTGCINGIKNAAQSSYPFSPALTVANPSLACYCDGDGKTITCGDASCTTAGRGNNEVFVTVTTTETFTPAVTLPTLSGFPVTLNGLTVLRLQ